MRGLEHVFNNTDDAFDGVKVCSAQRATGITRFMFKIERRRGLTFDSLRRDKSKNGPREREI